MKILIADDHTLFRDGLRHILYMGFEGNPEILEAGSFDQALEIATRETDIDLALIDMMMPGMDVFEVLRILADQAPNLPVVIISSSTNPEDMKQAIDAGALGFIPKSESTAVMLTALRIVQSGGIYIPSVLAATAGNHEDLHLSDTGNRLTRRQKDVLTLMARGFSNKQIATELDLSQSTVKAHITSIFKLLKVCNRTQAVIAAEKSGLVDK